MTPHKRGTRPWALLFCERGSVEMGLSVWVMLAVSGFFDYGGKYAAYAQNDDVREGLRKADRFAMAQSCDDAACMGTRPWALLFCERGSVETGLSVWVMLAVSGFFDCGGKYAAYAQNDDVREGLRKADRFAMAHSCDDA